MAKRAGYTAIISTVQVKQKTATIADIAVATNAGQIKTGAPHVQTVLRNTTNCFASKTALLILHILAKNLSIILKTNNMGNKAFFKVCNFKPRTYLWSFTNKCGVFVCL